MDAIIILSISILLQLIAALLALRLIWVTGKSPAWGLIAAWLLLFRRYMNRASGFWNWLGRRSYSVYVIHPVVLVGISLVLSGWVAPALVKLAVTGALACSATWMLADPLVRAPGLRKIL